MAVNSAQAQGEINLDNYDSTPSPQVMYNSAAAPTGWSVGLYYALGSITVASDPSGTADPTTLGALTLASGSPGDSTSINSGAGYFTTSTGDANILGYSSGLVTLEVSVYNGANYGASTIRGHSGAFTMTPATGTTAAPLIGSAMPTFSAFNVTAGPEPSILALAGLGAAALMTFRRKK